MWDFMCDLFTNKLKHVLHYHPKYSILQMREVAPALTLGARSFPAWFLMEEAHGLACGGLLC
jgi:hypothetical protein